MTNTCLRRQPPKRREPPSEAIFDPDKTLNGAIALAAAGDLAGPVIALMRAVFACPAANARLREAMILELAVRLNCKYAVHASTQIALNSGLSQTEGRGAHADGSVAG